MRERKEIEGEKKGEKRKGGALGGAPAAKRRATTMLRVEDVV